MNILPKKRWHVRTKENIARVRRDEAKATEEEKQREERAKLAERESRTDLLRSKARERVNAQEYIALSTDVKIPPTNEEESHLSTNHINFFQDLEDGTAEYKKSNAEHDKEKKEEQEKYEKQIGYLTYLGQDTNEALGKKNWYDVAPNRSDVGEAEVNMKTKILHDPLNVIKKYLYSLKTELPSTTGIEYTSCIRNSNNTSLCKKHKRKRGKSSSSEGNNDGDYAKLSHKLQKKHKKKKHKHKKHKSCKSKTKDASSGNELYSEDEDEKLKKKKKLEQLRIERLNREKEERRKSEILLAKMRGENTEEPKTEEKTVKQRYNSQFNPELAKQNYDFGFKK
ncbi:hypothetical protein ILUMI_10532 [Ignelater luminosus]|uniref:CBF1-interacting co-repressor CIR N-terminal domain-containing protein n=1 Tax=Ignelater luminosus TaxID=2038154 RepID=A0A8K0CXP5_IGNLU|nr:hypothetical protein ILUMI_10532 [Ignelater luminosus]